MSKRLKIKQPLSETNVYLKGISGRKRLAQSVKSSTAIETGLDRKRKKP